MELGPPFLLLSELLVHRDLQSKNNLYSTNLTGCLIRLITKSVATILINSIDICTSSHGVSFLKNEYFDDPLIIS